MNVNRLLDQPVFSILSKGSIPLLVIWVLWLGGCSQKRPVFYPNWYYQEVGKGIAQADIDDCMQLAKEHGTRSSSSGKVAKGTATGAAVGAATGAAVGAVLGNAGRGAAAGAAGGGAGGFTRGLFRSRDPDPVFRRFVERCLREKGYEVIGWK